MLPDVSDPFISDNNPKKAQRFTIENSHRKTLRVTAPARPCFLRSSLCTSAIVSLVLIILTCQLVLAGSSEQSSSGAQMDFVAYWAAARLLTDGQNAYSPTSLLEMQQKVGFRGTEPLVMWNPPWTFALTLPFGLFDYFWSQFLWLAVSTFAVLFSSQRLWRIYSGSVGYSRMPWLLALTFFPTILVLLFGQMSPLILLGLTAFVCFVQRQKWMAAGVALAVVAVKPHFIYLFWIVLILWIWRQRQWSMLLGAGLAGLAAAALPLIFDPAVYSHYLDLYRTASLPMPLDLPAPTLRNALIALSPVNRGVVEYLPLIIGIGWILFYWHRHKNRWNWDDQLPLVLLVSLVTSTYTWTFDQVVLLPALCQGAAWMRERKLVWYGKAAAVLYGGVDLLYLTMKLSVVYDFYYFWMAPTLLIIYLMLKQAYMSASKIRRLSD
jgi:hypothetical protein